jgi:FkbM family methyltransferase
MISNVFGNFSTGVRERGLGATLVSFAHILRWNFLKRCTGAEVLARKIHGYKMYLSLREPGISETLNMFGGREPEHVWIIDRVLRPGMTVFDIGGNIGYYALMEASKVGSAGKVYAVEPSPANVRLLRMSVGLNKFENIMEVEQMAISDSVGERALSLSQESNLHSFHTEVDAELKTTLNLSGETINVKTSDLGAFIQNRRRPEFLRMDVEGHEVEILTNLAAVAAREQWFPAVLFETHAGQYDAAKHDIRKPFEALFALGYQAKYIASQREPAAGFANHGYRATEIVKDARRTRGIYTGVTREHALELITAPDQVRCVYLSRD